LSENIKLRCLRGEVSGVDGALSWRYPELDIAYFSIQGDARRARLDDYIEENDPDWALS